jgi:putative ABC transport system permease protein
VKALQTKLWRDFWRLRGQSLAIALVVIGGIAMLVMSLTNHQALTDTRTRFYAEYQFADVFASMQRAPLPLIDEVRTLPGVDQAQARIRVAVSVELDGYADAIIGQVLSLPEAGDPSLNRLFLREGRFPEQPAEVVLGEAFAQAHRLHPGDTLSATLNGRRQTLVISGIGLSPEFIYQIRAGEVFPDFERFAMLWMPREGLARAFDLDGAFNDIALSLRAGASEKNLIDALDRLLEPFGGLGAYGRAEQTSHRFLDEELKQLKTMSRLFGSIFLGVSAFLLSVVIGRLIATQREQIAVLKAFGYTRWQVGRHFAGLVLLMVGVGVLPGVALGAWMGRGMAGLYATFYRFPFLQWSVQPGVWAVATAFAVLAAALGTAQGLLRAFRLTPAEGMRPEAPESYRKTLSERLGAGGWLDAAARMVLRNLERRPLRSLLSILGMGLACGILVMSGLQRDAIQEMIDVQFGLAQRDDLSVSFTQASDWRAIDELRRLPGVLAVEPFRAAAITLRHGHRTYTTALQGLAAEPDLKRVLGSDLRAVNPPAQGLLLTDYLATLLALKPGDSVDVEFLDGRRERLKLPVAATVTEYLGVGAYAQREWLNRLRQEGDVVSGAWLRVAPEAHVELLRTLRERPRVAAVSDHNASLSGFRDTMAQNILTFTLVATLMAASIAAGVVYNAARITLAERARDLASLRILGYTQAEVRGLLLGELATLTLLSLLPGFAIGWALSALLVHGMTSDLYRVPLVLRPQGFAFAGAVLLVSAAFSAWLVLRRLDRLDLVAVLKTRE